jgi:ribonuclease P protein component
MASLDMLRSRLDFAALQSDARSRIDPVLVLRYRPNGQERTRYGISTGRRTGGAVVRNTIRRRLRRLLSELVGRVSVGWDVLIIARPPAAQASQAQLGSALERLLKQAGLLVPEAETRA